MEQNMEANYEATKSQSKDSNTGESHYTEYHLLVFYL